MLGDAEMEFKELGGTGVKIPEIGLGTAGYTSGSKPLRRGIDLGATHIDTAESYGTEDQVGACVAGIRNQVFISTKVSPGHFRHKDLINAANNSLKLLQTDHIDLYQLHRPNPDVPIAETMGAMDRLVQDGKVRFVGVSNFSVSELKAAQSATSNKIVSNQVRYSLSDRYIEGELLPYCQKHAVTVIAYSPLKAIWGGSLEALRSVAETTGKTEAQVALNWSTNRDGIVTIPKSNSTARIEENCGGSGWRLTEGQVTLLESYYKGSDC